MVNIFTIRDTVWDHIMAANPDTTFLKTIIEVYEKDDRAFFENVIDSHLSCFVDQQSNQP